MREDRRRVSCLVMLTALAAAAAPTAGARAEDLRLPPWERGSPLTTFYEWEFRSSETFLPPDSDRPPIIGDRGGMPWARISNMDHNPTGNGWIADRGGPGYIAFLLPNWYDFDPYKLVQVQLIHSPTETDPPFVAAMQGFKSRLPPPGYVWGERLGEPLRFGDYGIVDDWEFFPNPDYERVLLVVPEGTAIYRVTFDTDSAPEPGTSVLLGIGGLCLLTYAWRWRSRGRVGTVRREPPHVVLSPARG